MEQLQDAIRNGDNAEAATLQAQIDTVRQEAEDARAVGQDARAMVLRRDPRLTTLETLAAALGGAVIAGEDAHARLDDRIDDIELTPGPPGNDSTVPGPAGPSTYDIARQAGYAGTEDQWLASLQGQPGKAADMSVITALTARVATLEYVKMQVEYRDGVAVPPIASLLGISAAVDIVITWPAPFVDTAHIVTPQVSTNVPALIGKTALTLKAKTRDSFTVTVTSTALLSAGQATLSAVAYRKG